MRSLIGGFLRWLIHEHKQMTEYRVITQFEVPNEKGEWVDAGWIEMTWYGKCRCGHRMSHRFTSGFKEPLKPQRVIPADQMPDSGGTV